jgi:branched-chain amino acid transport system permease protein
VNLASFSWEVYSPFYPEVGHQTLVTGELQMETLVFGLLNGISFGFILFLLSAGLSLIMGVMGIFNLAHGALYMIGAYIGWTIAIRWGLNYLLAILAGGLFAGFVGLAIERVFFRQLYKQYTEQVLLSFGLIFIFTNLTQWIWGPISKAPFATHLLSGSVQFGKWSYPTMRFLIVIIGLVLAPALWWLQEKTRIGAIVRAGMDDKEMVMGLGINIEKVSILVFFLGSSIAGFAGVIGGQVLGANVDLALDVLLLAMVVVVVGGLGSVQGALLGGMLIGIIDAFGRAYFPPFALFTIYLAMVVILLARPAGLLGKKT